MAGGGSCSGDTGLSVIQERGGASDRKPELGVGPRSPPLAATWGLCLDLSSWEVGPVEEASKECEVALKGPGRDVWPQMLGLFPVWSFPKGS